MAWEVDYHAEYIRRWKLIQKANHDPKTCAALKKIYKHDPIRFIEDMGNTYDPRAKRKFIPFVLFPRQKQFIQFLQELEGAAESGLVEKCRDGGLTWLCVAYACWKWLFWSGSNIGFGSRKQDLVDKIGDADSILEKARMFLRKVPAFLRPDGFNDDCLTFLKLITPNGESIIKGEAGDNIGRGGRSEIVFKDESAHYERPEKIEAALSMNTNVQVDISSVNGPGNIFYRRRFAGEIWEPGKVMPKGKTWVFIFDWTDDPRKDQEWYDLKKAKFESEGLGHIFAQEIDRDYSASLDKIVIPSVWVRACVDAHIKLRIRDDGSVFGGQDLADGGVDKNSLVIRKGVILKFAEEWAGKADDAAIKAMTICMQFGVRELMYDSIGVGTSFFTQCKTMAKNNQVPKNMKIIGWNAGAGVLDPEKHMVYNDDGSPDITSPKNEDFFANLKAQGWWSLRTRIWKTYRAVVHAAVYPHDQLISIPSGMPNRHALEAQLSQATYDPNGKGKIVIDKQPDGASSPNLADGCVECYFPIKGPNTIFAF